MRRGRGRRRGAARGRRACSAGIGRTRDTLGAIRRLKGTSNVAINVIAARGKRSPAEPEFGSGSRRAFASVVSVARGLGAFALAAAACAAHADVGWSTLGGNAQHTGVSATAAQPLGAVRWSTPID